MSTNLEHEIFWTVHNGLPREAPGSDEATLQALAMLPDLPTSILDIGCGPGAQTIALARACSQASIIAVDTHQPFLDELSRRAKQTGAADHVRTLNASMFELDLEERFDLIWSEGAIYIIGFEEGLRQWKKLLKPRGTIAVTEISWLKPNPPEEVLRFWGAAYPDMADIEENLRRVRVAGFQSLGLFTLPQSAWWDNYYHPMEKRIEELRKKYLHNTEAQRVLDMEYAEIELYGKYADWYGYVFYVMQAAE